MARIGTVIDNRYRLTDLLGRGGMGSVYRAEHVVIRRPVAVKVLSPEIGNTPEIAARFEREAFATGRVTHPNCVTVSDAGRLEDGGLYLAMELVDGISLVEALRDEERFDYRRALHIARHVLRALRHAHGAGVVHRDIKPENVILVDQDGDRDFAKVLDFGIAKLVDESHGPLQDTGLTQVGMTIGTPAYMSPEQAFGQPVDARSDLYSTSVMLFEMIAGTPPFVGGDTLAVLSMHAGKPVPRFADVAPVAVPSGVEGLVRWGLAKDRAQRVPSADEYIRHIDTLLGASGTSTTATRPPEAWRQWLAGWRLAVVGALAGMVLLALAVAMSGEGEQSAGGAPAVSVPVFSEEEPAEPSAIALEARAAFERGEPEAAIETLEGEAEQIRDDPDAQLVLGHAYAAVQRKLDAARAYRRAAALASSAVEDRTLRTNLGFMLDDEDDEVVAAGLDVLGVVIDATGDEAAGEQLVEIATTHERIATRHRALALAEKLGLDGAIDRLALYTRDLEQAEPCEVRRKAVGKLRALGDKRAIPALIKARKRIRRGGILGLSSRNTNRCLVEDADEAIAYLEAL